MPISHAERWVEPGSAGGILSAQLMSRFTGSRPGVLLLRLRQLLDLVHLWRMPQIFSGAAQPLGLLDQQLLSLCLPRQIASNLRRRFA